MCELLIKATNHTHPDQIKDRQGAYKRGMVVRVEEDGHQWGAKEGLPKFVLVKIPSVPAAKAQALIEQQTDDDDGVEQGIPGPDGIEPLRFRRRRWWFLIDNIPNAIKNQLRNNGEVTVTVAQIRDYLRRIRDNAQYTDLDT